MSRLLSIALLAAFLLSSPSLAEDRPWAEAKRIIDTATAEVKKNRDACETANEKPVEEARLALQDLASRLAKEGDTSGASAVLKRIGTLEREVLGKPAPAPQKPLLERLEGKWDITNEPRHYRIYANGTAECVQDTDGRVVSRGRITVSPPYVAEATWDSGWKDHFRISGDDAAVAVFSWDPAGKRNGVGFALERIK